MLTHEQKVHNAILDVQIKLNDANYKSYVDNMDKARKDFYEANPDFHCKTMFLTVCAKKQICAIRYID